MNTGWTITKKNESVTLFQETSLETIIKLEEECLKNRNDPLICNEMRDKIHDKDLKHCKHGIV